VCGGPGNQNWDEINKSEVVLFFLVPPSLPSFFPSFSSGLPIINQSIVAHVCMQGTVQTAECSPCGGGCEGRKKKRKEGRNRNKQLHSKRKRKTAPLPPTSNAGTSFGEVSYLISVPSGIFAQSDWRERRRKGRTEPTTACCRSIHSFPGAYPTYPPAGMARENLLPVGKESKASKRNE